MIIRTEQMGELGRAADKELLESAVRHMQEFSPTATRAAGEENVRKAAELGLAKARSYGFTRQGSLLLFLDLMILFGSRFDDDPLYGWVQPYLKEMNGVNAFQRSRLLYWHVEAFLDRAHGENGERVQQALERAVALDLTRLRATAESFPNRGPQLLQWLHPQRMDFLEQQTILSAWEAARAAGFGAAEGAVLVLLLRFAFGHGVLEDPLHPWVGRPEDLQREELQTRIVGLSQRARAYARAIASPRAEARS